ncbi:MAG: hypothetical protein ABI648_16905, partial [Betaproteobacteria bacterium]
MITAACSSLLAVANVAQHSITKVKHWRGFQAKIARRSAPVLVIAVLISKNALTSMFFISISQQQIDEDGIL